MLANCTSGYADYVAQDSFVDALYKDPFRAWTTEEQLDFVADKPLLYEPGKNWSYAHTNFVLLGEALSAITDKPVDELIRERIIEPLGMHGTQSHQTAVIPEPVLHAYTKERGTYEESTFWNPSWTLAKGSVMITDIYTWPPRPAPSAQANGCRRSPTRSRLARRSSAWAGLPRSAPRTSARSKHPASTTASVPS